jgi:hypothetical protein
MVGVGEENEPASFYGTTSRTFVTAYGGVFLGDSWGMWTLKTGSLL